MPVGPSRTAEWVCLFRAIEQRRPAPDRLVDDPWARSFLSPGLRRVADRGLLAWLGASVPRSPLSPGSLVNFALARHRFMDDALAKALDGGCEQVVILGAGYDSRAYRFARQLGGRPLFEVDFPATQAEKRERAKDVPHADVHYVPVDFERQRFSDRLKDSGFRVGAKTFFVWEGVSMYLGRDTVAATFDALRALSGAASGVVVDFYHPPHGRALWKRVVRSGTPLFSAIGEPLDFAIRPAEVPAFLGTHGFDVVDHLDGHGLEARYALGPRRVFPFLHVAHAVTRAVSGPPS